ncbi:MAG TPA: FAD-linked oxidase C-terminal domain-containing protein [Stellaceae bacterium]|jgi:FAD/FMN-containing dehydrogenase/Fe-S oxidoreductase|nr:FAD-linked oxidase C-terminal domain-containing protein [Stellaceae bacterium]
MPLDNLPTSRLEQRLRRETQAETLFDPFSRGRYSTDASIYQIEPLGIVVPKTREDVATILQIAREEGVPVLPRGGGTSQCGQTVARALVVDCSKYMNAVVALDVENRRVTVQPGVVMERLNQSLRRHKLWFPVDVSTGDRATIGGMTANNSCGSRSIRYGNMVHNVRAIDALLADGTAARFEEVSGNFAESVEPERYRSLVREMRDLHRREADEIEARFPKLLRRVGGYNINMVADEGHNMAHLLVGSEGTLAFFNEIELDLAPIPAHRALGICHFPSFYQAMEAPQHIVKLGPSAVELVDRTMIELSRENPVFRPIVDRFVQGEPEAILLTEFAGDDPADNLRRLKQLVELMGDLGLPGSVVEATDQGFQSAIWNVRKEGLNIMMSIKGDGKPISFIEDCAVRLEDLAEYTDRLTQVFHKHGTYGTWYAHASVGTLHVRPVINLKQELGAKQMRAIAEEAFAMVREYKGSHSGEHGDGLVRSEHHEAMFGSRIVRAFEEVKDTFDPTGLFNPGKIVRPTKMDDRSLFRFKPGYTQVPIETALDWSDWGGFASAAEMCNNNGACRKSDPGVMCPSYRATGDEQHLTRGRANTLRLALSGQLGPDALTSDAMRDTMALCVSCKGCRRECPTGVDMAKMKIEFRHHYNKRHGLSWRDRLVAYLPRYAPYAARIAGLLNLRRPNGLLARIGERLFGLSANRPLPHWSSRPYDAATPSGSGPEVMLLVDTFNRYFEPENAAAAERVLTRAGYRVTTPRPQGRPLCCGRSFLAAGLVDEAKAEARRMLAALAPAIAAGTPIVGLEPSCLLTLRDEFPSMLPGAETTALANRAQLFEEFVETEHAAGRFNLPVGAMPGRKALLHGHCHQKAFATAGAAVKALQLIPELEVETFDSTCCGMAGAFGYEAEHYEMSLRIGELGVLPRMRAAPSDTLLAACGTSCRHQIADAAQRDARHIVRILDEASAATPRV